MGKAKKVKPSQMVNKVPLEQDIEDAQFARNKIRSKIRLRQDEDESFVDETLSRKILSAARKQQREVDEDLSPATGAPGTSKFKAPKLDTRDDSDSEQDEEDSLEPDTFYENIEINEEDEKAIAMFMSNNPLPSRTLADIIMEKITEKQTELETRFSDAGTLQVQDLDPKIKALYEGVRDVPEIQKREVTKDPPSWSAAAMYEATRIFTSNLKANMAQRFYNLVLFPRIRDDLAEYKRLNFHLYQALRKALFKPGAFMKGIILPLLESGNCTLREAIIIGSVVARNSIPILHSSAAILKIAEMDYTGANSIFLRIFYDKKYALPYRVVDASVFHFLRFQNDRRELPVLWHQAFLTFVQRYKADISSEQRDSLLELLKKQNHHTITAEIRRELQHAKCRDLEDAVPKMDFE